MRDIPPSELASEFLAALQNRCPDPPASLADDGGPVVAIPPRHPEVGGIRVRFERSEITVHTGEHHHSHFECWLDASRDVASRRAEAVGRAVRHVRDVITERVLLYVRYVDGRRVGSGVRAVDGAEKGLRIPADAKAYVWSGPLEG